MKTLSTRTIHVIEAVAETLFDAGDGCEPSRLRWFVADLDDFLYAAGIKTRIAMYFSLFTIQFAPLFLIGRAARFTRLPPPERLKVLERYEVSPLSLCFAAVKLIFALIYFEHPDTMRECNLDPKLVWPGVDERMGRLAPAGLPAVSVAAFSVDDEPAAEGVSSPLVAAHSGGSR